MAIALVGSVGSLTTSGTGSIQPPFGQATTAGNLLVAWCYNGTAATFPTIDQSWSLAARKNGTNDMVVIFYKANCGASETAPTMTQSGGGGTLVAALAEFSGAATASPLDKTGTSNGTVSPITVSASAADTNSGSLILTADSFVLSKAGTQTGADSYNNGATPTTNFNNDATSSATHYRLAWGITTGNTVADSNSVSSTSMNLSAICGAIASFSPAAVVLPLVGPEPIVVCQAVKRASVI